MADETQKQPKPHENPFNTGAIALDEHGKQVRKFVGKTTEVALANNVPPEQILRAIILSFPEIRKQQQQQKQPQQQQGQSQQDILRQVLDLANTPIETGGKSGLIPSLLRTGKLKRAPRTEPLGITGAVKVLQLQNQSQQTASEAPLKQAQLKKILQEIVKGTGEGAAAFERVKQESTARFKEKEKQAEFTADTISFIQGFEVAEQEIIDVIGPEVLETGPGGLIARGIGSLAKAADLLPKSSAFVKNILVNANKMARTIEGGRVTDGDRQIYADALANSLENPSEENTELIVSSLRNMKNKGGDISLQVNALLRSSSNTLSAAGLQIANPQQLRAFKIETLKRIRQ